jgi:hypothetical protein
VEGAGRQAGPGRAGRRSLPPGIQPRRDGQGEWFLCSPSQGWCGGGPARKPLPRGNIGSGGMAPRMPVPPGRAGTAPAREPASRDGCRRVAPRDPGPAGRGGNSAPPVRCRGPGRVPGAGGGGRVRRPALRRLRHFRARSTGKAAARPSRGHRAEGIPGPDPTGLIAEPGPAGSCPPPDGEVRLEGSPGAGADALGGTAPARPAPALDRHGLPARDRPCRPPGGIPAPWEAAAWPEPASPGPGNGISARGSLNARRRARRLENRSIAHGLCQRPCCNLA